MDTKQRIAQYELLRPLGRGGMATVFLARDCRLDRPVALKLLRPGLAARATARRRFLQEARAAARLDHPGVVPIFDWGQAPAGPYLASAYIAGGSLATRLRDLAARQQRLPLADTLHILAGIAAALDHAHQRGIVHRDVKPDNILLRAAAPGAPPRPLLTDFGLALPLGAQREQQGLFVGTPAYMAPEQVRDEALDGRANLYALGVVAFRMLVGTLPFVVKTPFDAYRCHCGQAPPDIAALRPDLPPALIALVQRALAKAPEARLQSGAEFAAAARQALDVVAAPPRRRPAPPLITLTARPLTRPVRAARGWFRPPAVLAPRAGG